MAFLELYNNLSHYTLYKGEVNILGINSLLIFNLDGIPFIVRDYSADTNKTSNDFIFLSAFISSIFKFSSLQGINYITDFGIGTSRFYIKFDHNKTAYCIVLNELIHRRITGEQLIQFVEVSSNELRKLFNTYRNGDKYLEKVKFDEKFCLQIDRMFINNYTELVKQSFETQYLTDYLFNHDILITPPPNSKYSIMKSLLNLGILALLICRGGEIPVIIRNYETGTLETDDDGHFMCGLSHLLNKFALSNFGFFTDVGFGFQRVIFKFKTENRITLCLILSETLYMRVNGETLNMFSELMLTRIHGSIKSSLPHLHDTSLTDSTDPLVEETTAKLDSIMLDNAKIIYQELNN